MKIREYKNIGETLASETLQNGLTVHVLRKPSYNKAFAYFATNYGGADRRFRLDGNWIDTPAGVAHFLEHKMFDTPDGGNALAVMSANGASPNAYTSAGITAYHFECTDNFEDNLRVLLSFVSVPHFTPESVEKEQGIIGQEIRMMEDSPGYVVYYSLMRSLYTHNPLRDSVAGTVESIAEITDTTLYDCHKVFYNPSNMVLCVVGDVDPERVVELAREQLSGDAGIVPERDYGGDEPELPSEKYAEAVMEVSSPLFVFGSRLTPAAPGEGRLRQKLVSNLALECLLGRSSPFYTSQYSAGLINDNFGFEVDYVAGTAMTLVEGESSNPQKVLDEVLAAAKRAGQEGLDAQLFDRIKKASYGDRLRSLGSFGAICRSLADGRFTGYAPLDSFEMLAAIEKEEAEAFITEAFDSSRIAMSVVRSQS